MTARDFEAELRREEAARQAEGLPEGVRRAIWGRIEGTIGASKRPPRAALLVPALAAGALAAIILVVAGLRAPARLGELEVVRRSHDLRARVESGLIQVERGAVTLVDSTSGVTIEADQPAAFRRESGGLRVVRGRLDFVVARRRTGAPPATVFVSGGSIEVMGTAFTVVQGTAGGEVRLREGSIRFRGSEGAEGSEGLVVWLRPGESLSWPLPAPAPLENSAPVPSPAGPAPKTTRGAPPPSPSRPPPAAATPRSAEELLDHIEELRSRHEYAAAARALREALPLQPPPTRERLSFELGSLLTHQLRDPPRACAHWRWHQRQFGGGRYRDEVTRARHALGCTGGSANRAPGTP